MSLNVLEHTNYVLSEISEQEQWDQIVNEHLEGHFLQSWSWGELKASSGWGVVRLVLWDGERIVAAAQVLQKGVPHVPLRLGHMAYIPKGPVIDWSQTQRCKVFFALLGRYLRQRGALALRIEPGQEATSESGEQVRKQLAAIQMRPVHAIQPLRTIVLDLAPAEETLLAQMKEKWRYNVRLAGRKGVSVRVAESLEDVDAWYRLLETTGERDSFGIHTLEYYRNAWTLCARNGQLRLLLAEREEELLAGIFVALYAKQAIYLYGASSNEQRQYMPNYLLQWEAIRWARQQGATQYDFWGIPETEAEEEAMAGVYRFKRGWGGRVVQFIGCYEQVYHPLVMKVANRFV